MNKYQKMTSSLNGDKKRTHWQTFKQRQQPQFQVSTAAEKLQISQKAQENVDTTTAVSS